MSVNRSNFGSSSSRVTIPNHGCPKASASACTFVRIWLRFGGLPLASLPIVGRGPVRPPRRCHRALGVLPRAGLVGASRALPHTSRLGSRSRRQAGIARGGGGGPTMGDLSVLGGSPGAPGARGRTRRPLVHVRRARTSFRRPGPGDGTGLAQAFGRHQRASSKTRRLGV